MFPTKETCLTKDVVGYFLRIVKKRLLDQYGLVKYKPLVSFNAKLMVVSILMDVSRFPLSIC